MQIQLSIRDEKTIAIKIGKFIPEHIKRIKMIQHVLLHHQVTAPYVRPKKETKLPNVLLLDEVMLVLKIVNNLKHQALLYLTYSSGLYDKVREEKTGLHCFRMPLMRLGVNISSSRNLIHGYFPGKPPGRI